MENADNNNKTEWFKVKIMYPVESSPDGFTHNDKEEDEEDPILKRIRMESAGVTDSVEYGFAYFNLLVDPVMHLIPGSYLPKDGKNKRTYTLIVFESGNSVTAAGNSDDIHVQLIEFMKKD